jgi:hypothetical protein
MLLVTELRLLLYDYIPDIASHQKEADFDEAEGTHCECRILPENNKYAESVATIRSHISS